MVDALSVCEEIQFVKHLEQFCTRLVNRADYCTSTKKIII